MNEFIKQNRRLLKFYCTAALIIGWLLIIGGFVWFIPTVTSIDINDDYKAANAHLYVISSMLFDFLLPGLIALGIVQFIRYLFEDTTKAGCILRNADRFFYMYAGFLIVRTYLQYFWNCTWYAEVIESETSRLLFIQPFLLPAVAKVLILVGLAQILRRILPVIEESKTLV
ncbi:MAG: hypothetical protein IH584_03790 [Candidatus Aminicenantes bacterium]|nr:hypothetical protein [Candidatus Aminicenantes bacterium]